jgi:hypothetical protein
MSHRRQLLVVLLLAVSLLLAAPAHAGYCWPVKPFDRQHPVRGSFGDPRIAGRDYATASIHFGIDIPAPDGSPVYATIDGVAARHSLHADVVRVLAGAVVHEYWHVIPAVAPGSRVFARRTIVGHVEAPWKHVHFSEMLSGLYMNPLRPGALTPYRDTTAPAVGAIDAERSGRPVGTRLSGTVDLVAEAADTAAIACPPPWDDKPVSPALVEWRFVANGRTSGWRTAVDFRNALPATSYAAVYAPWTRQNHPWRRGGTGRYRFYLARAFDPRTLPNGTYRLEVRAGDTAGNEGRAARTFVVWNAAGL